MMRIAFVIPSLDSGGAERLLADLANYLIEKGYDVAIIHAKPQKYEPFYPVHNSVNMLSMCAGKILHPKGKLAKSLVYLKFLKHIRKSIKQEKPDVVISFLTMTNIMTLAATRGLNVPVVVYDLSNPYLSISVMQSWLVKLSYQNAFKVLTQTKTQHAYYSFIKKKNKSVIANSVDKLHQKTFYDSAQSIVSIGRLIDSKDFATLVSAFAKISLEFSEIKLTIYGEGENRSVLEKQINDLGLTEKVFLPGNKKNVKELLHENDLFVFPSRYEGLPCALLEAMAAGLPVIVSNGPGNIDLVQDGFNGLIFPVGDVDACADLMRKLIEDSQKREFLGTNAKKTADAFEPGKIFAQWEALIESAVSSQND